MRVLSRGVVVGALLLVGPLRVGAQTTGAESTAAPGPEAAAPPAAAPSKPEASTSAIEPARLVPIEPKAEAKATAAAATIPQVLAIRLGSLGIPSNGSAEGVQASLDSKTDFKGVDTNAFGKLGGIQLHERLFAEFMAETFQESLPRTLKMDPPVIPRLAVQDLSSLGFRLRIRALLRKYNVYWVNTKNTCELQLQENREKALEAASKAQESNENTAGGSGALAKAPCTAASPPPAGLSAGRLNAATKNSGLTFTLGGRFVRRAALDPNGEDSQGAAGELAIQYGSDTKGVVGGANLGWQIFGSFSLIHLGSAGDLAGSTRVEFPSLYEWKAIVGSEVHANGLGGDVLPTFGLFAAMSENYWTNIYAHPGTEAEIHGRQLEGAVYFTGNFLRGFQGMVSFGVVEPFGGGKAQYILSLVPSVGAPLPGGDTGKTDAGGGQ